LTGNSVRHAALRILIGMLRGRLEAITAEMADAQHFLDEIEAVSGLRPTSAKEEKPR
jgi:hypothetical protein